MAKQKKLTKKAVKNLLKKNPEMLYKPMSDDIKQLFPVVTVDIASDYFGLHFTVKHNAKMTGFNSLSTTCKTGDCPKKIEKAFKLVVPDFDIETATKTDIKRVRKLLSDYIKKNPLAKNVSVCGFCYSDRQQDYMTSMKNPLVRNFEILNGGIIHDDWLPTINSLYFRLESFGDFASKNAVINAVNIMKKNPDVFFGVWSKNLKYFHMVFAGDLGNKPHNCNIIYSSQFVNKVSRVPERFRYFVDKTFTVYTEKYMDDKNITCNCGARACLTCLNCYKKNAVENIRETIK